jgi:hypothetical protein
LEAALPRIKKVISKLQEGEEGNFEDVPNNMDGLAKTA